MKRHIFYCMMALAAACSFTSCDWNDPEAVGNHFGGITEVNPPAYSEYLQNLRNYRNNGHKKVYVWFDNKESFSSQADHVATVPDSIDVLVLNHPEKMTQAVLDEIDTKRSNTGMQTAYAISYQEIRKAWELEKSKARPKLGIIIAMQNFQNSLNISTEEALTESYVYTTAATFRPLRNPSVRNMPPIRQHS